MCILDTPRPLGFSKVDVRCIVIFWYLVAWQMYFVFPVKRNGSSVMRCKRKGSLRWSTSKRSYSVFILTAGPSLHPFRSCCTWVGKDRRRAPSPRKRRCRFGRFVSSDTFSREWLTENPLGFPRITVKCRSHRCRPPSRGFPHKITHLGGGVSALVKWTPGFRKCDFVRLRPPSELTAAFSTFSYFEIDQKLP